MSNRVLLGALDSGGFGLRVSRPGYDVTNAGLAKEQLAFDSRWPEVSNVWMSGGGTLSGVSSLHMVNINFGTTFATPPMVFVTMWYKVPDQTSLTLWHLASNLDGATPYGGPLCQLVVTTSYFQLLGNAVSNGKLYNYVVLRNVYG